MSCLCPESNCSSDNVAWLRIDNRSCGTYDIVVFADNRSWPAETVLLIKDGSFGYKHRAVNCSDAVADESICFRSEAPRNPSAHLGFINPPLHGTQDEDLATAEFSR